MLCLVGSPLSGKSLVCDILSKGEQQISIISTGDIARQFDSGLEDRTVEQIKKDVSAIANDRINTTIKYAMLETEALIIDGFPRSEEQIDILLRNTKNAKVVFLYCNPMVAVERANGRKRDKLDLDNSKLEARYTASLALYELLKSKMGSESVIFIDNTRGDVEYVADIIGDLFNATINR